MPSAYIRALLVIGVCFVFELIFSTYFQGNARFLMRAGFVAGVLLGLLLLSPVARYLGAFTCRLRSTYGLELPVCEDCHSAIDCFGNCGRRHFRNYRCLSAGGLEIIFVPPTASTFATVTASTTANRAKITTVNCSRNAVISH